jgi:hypothetical protein
VVVPEPREVLRLAGVRLAAWFPSLGFFQKADGVAALLVAGLVIVVSVSGCALFHSVNFIPFDIRRPLGHCPTVGLEFH